MKYGGFFIIMEKRKAFNFYRSYYEVAMKLSNEDRSEFLTAIMKKQFEDVEPELSGMAEFAYVSQKHNIDNQVSGYKNKISRSTTEPPSLPPTEPPYLPPTEPPYLPPSLEEKGEEEGEEKGKDLEKYLVEELDLDKEADKVLEKLLKKN